MHRCWGLGYGLTFKTDGMGSAWSVRLGGALLGFIFGGFMLIKWFLRRFWRKYGILFDGAFENLGKFLG